MKNMTNNTMYVVKELHAFASNGIAFSGIATNRTAFNGIAFNEIASKVSL